MTRIDQLRKRFASGMAQGTISAEDWEEEVLPMMLNAERYVWLRDSSKCSIEIPIGQGWLGWFIGNDLDAAIDSARTPTKEQTE